MAEENEQGQAVDLSSLGSFDFAPSWAAGEKVVAKSGRGGFRDAEDTASAPRDDGGRRRFQGAKQSDSRPFPRDEQFRKQSDRDRRKDRPSGRGDFHGKPFERGGRDAGRRGPARREFIKPLDAETILHSM